VTQPKGRTGALLRRFILAFGFSSVVLLLVSYLFFQTDSQHRILMARDEEAHAVDMRRIAVGKSLSSDVSDLLLLADLSGLRNFLLDDTPTHRADLTRELVAFLRQRETYGRVSVVTPAGATVVSVMRNGGDPRVLPTDALGSADALDGLRETADCGVGTLLVSAMDLRTENGTPVLPREPVMRLGIALRRAGGAMASTLVLDVLGASLLQSLAEAHPEASSMSMLLDQSGYWIQGANPASEWGSVVPGCRDVGFQYSFPTEWERIATTGAGQFETRNGLFTYTAIYPGMEVEAAACGPSGSPHAESLGTGAEIRWTIVSHVPRSGVLLTMHGGLSGLLVSSGFGLIAIGLGSWILAQRTLRSRELRHRVETENRLLSSTLGRYLPPEISARMLRDPSRYNKLGGEMQHVAVLFADLRGFTGFSETRSPDVVVAALNRALTELTSPVLGHRGILDKYMGDGLLAFFEPAPAPADAARRAVAAAREMQTAFARLRRETALETLGDLGLGIGISIGQVIVGNIGSEEVMNYTIVGDTVNVAARLQTAAEAGQILLTEAVYELVREDLSAMPVQSLTLKGRRQTVNVYQLCSEGEDA
jgi:class 3 adenylate cyclase